MLLGGTWPAISRGEDEEESRATAKRLTSEGAAAYKAEDFAHAIDKFDAAYRLYPAAPLLLNISRANLKLSRCPEAIHYAELFKAALLETKAASQDSPDAWLVIVQRSCIEAEVDSNPPGATIWINGERQTSPDKTPWTGRLPVGKHKILLWRPGYQKQGAFLTVTADSPAHLELNLYSATTPEAVPVVTPTPPAPAPAVQTGPPPVVAAAPPPPINLLPPPPATAETGTQRATRSPLLRKLGYVGIAVGGAALVAAIVLGVTVQNEKGAIGKITAPRTVPQADAELSSSQSEAGAADALYVVGGVLAVAGVPLAVVF